MTQGKSSKKDRRPRRMAKEKKKFGGDNYLQKQVRVLKSEPLGKYFGNFLRKGVRKTQECREFSELERLKSLKNLKIRKVKGE